MAQGSYAFTGATTPDPSQGYGANMYAQQGQQKLNPGQAAVQAANPVTAGGMADLAKALQGAFANNPTPPQSLPPGVGETALAAGAQMNPNTPSGENMGGVGPTQQNLALAQGLMQGQGGGVDPNQMMQMMQQPQGLQSMQNYQNGISGGGYMGGFGGS